MISNRGTAAKYNVKVPVIGQVAVLEKDRSEDLSCFAETVLRVEVTGVGVNNEIQIYGRIRSSDLWHYISTVKGAVTGLADISTYDYVRYFCSVPDGQGELTASGFFLTNQSTANGYLKSIDEKLDVFWDTITTTFPTANQDLFTYSFEGVGVQTVLVTYQDTTKKQIVSVNKTRL